MIDHERIMGTLEGFLKSRIPEINTWGRRVQHWSKVSAQPAIFFRHTADDDSWSGPGQCITSMEVELWLYCKSGPGKDETPDKVLNKIAQKVRQALLPDDTDSGFCTMGGKVYYVRIEGRSEFDPGDLDDQAKATIPLTIVLPN